MRKRILSLLLALTLTISLVCVPVSAAGTPTIELTADKTTVLSSSTEQELEISVLLHNPTPETSKVSGISFDLKSDKTELALASKATTLTTAFGTGYTTYNTPRFTALKLEGLYAGYISETEVTLMTIKATLAANAPSGKYVISTDEMSVSDTDANGLFNTNVSITINVVSAISNDLPVAIAKPERGVTPETAISGTNYTGSIAWTPAVTGGKFAANTEYTANVTLTAKDGYQFASDVNPIVTNATSVTDKNVADAGKTLTFKAAFPKTGSVTVTKVVIGGAAPTLNVPEAADFGVPGTVTVPRTYSVDVHTDDGILTNPDGVKWSVSGLEGVTVNPDTGDLTISSNCPEGKIKLTAAYGGKSDTAELTVFRATPVVKWLKIVDKKTGGAPQTTIIRPVGDDPADMIDVEYEAKVYDQFSQPATITKVDWELKPIPKHMGTLETVDKGILTLHVSHDTETIPFDLTATLKANPTIKDTVEIKVEDKPLKTLEVTQADSTYGTPLADPVFTEPEGTTKTLVHYSTPTSSAYSSDTPPTDAGEYVVNVICETPTHIYMGHANFKIEPKSISNMLQPITGTYEYTGTPQKPTAVVKDGEVTLVEGKDYNVRYGTNVHVFEAATVYVDGIGNYKGTFSRNFEIQPKPIDITSVSTTNRDYVEGNVNVDCAVTLPVASDVKQGEHYLVFATMADDTAGTGKTVNVQVKMVKGNRGENYTLNNDTTTASVNINKINPADPTGLKGVKGQKLSAVELPAGWTWDAPDTVMNTAGNPSFAASYVGDTNHNAVSAHPITVTVLDKTDVSTFITFPDGEKEYTGSWMEYKEASINGTNLGTGAKWNYVYTAGTGTLLAGYPQGVGTYTVTVTYEDSLNHGTATATLTIVPRKVAIPAADTTVFTYDGNAKTYGIADTADYTVTGATQTNANEAGYTVTVALKDKTNTAWTDSTTADKTYTFKIMKATPTGEPAYTKITTRGKTLADANLTVGTITPAGTISWDAGNAQSVAANTAYDWTFKPTDTVNYNNLTGSITPYTVSHSGDGSSYNPTYAVVVDKTKNGDITASPKAAAKGTIVTLTIDPDKGYELDALEVLDKNGDRVKLTEKNGKYTFVMPASKVTVKGSFAAEAPEQIFFDVPVNAYYYDAVKWAADKGITGGVSPTLFAPDQSCTRAQIVTFLWRAAGSPAPKSMSTFVDVSADAYYAKAVAWAVENGITGGTGNGKFSPDATCTRAQAVTFLYRANGAPAVVGSAVFSDVAANAYYANAVVWAEKNGVTGGIGGGLFGSDNNFTRAQIVTFLYRSVK